MVKILRSNKAITLIELIAVLVIMGIIAAIAIPTIGNVIEEQRVRAAEAEWSAIESAGALYIAQNSGVTAFSMDDLYNANYISENVVLESDANGTVVASSADVFEPDNGALGVDDVNYPALYIDGVAVYPGA